MREIIFKRAEMHELSENARCARLGRSAIASYKKAQLLLTNPRDAVKIRVGSLKVIESDTIQ